MPNIPKSQNSANKTKSFRISKPDVYLDKSKNKRGSNSTTGLEVTASAINQSNFEANINILGTRPRPARQTSSAVNNRNNKNLAIKQNTSVNKTIKPKGLFPPRQQPQMTDMDSLISVNKVEKQNMGLKQNLKPKSINPPRQGPDLFDFDSRPKSIFPPRQEPQIGDSNSKPKSVFPSRQEPQTNELNSLISVNTLGRPPIVANNSKSYKPVNNGSKKTVNLKNYVFNNQNTNNNFDDLCVMNNIENSLIKKTGYQPSNTNSSKIVPNKTRPKNVSKNFQKAQEKISMYSNLINRFDQQIGDIQNS